jgi:hypothetical protein
MQDRQSSNAVSLVVCLISNVLFSPSLLDADRLGAFRPVDRYFRAELLKQRESVSEACVANTQIKIFTSKINSNLDLSNVTHTTKSEA